MNVKVKVEISYGADPAAGEVIDVSQKALNAVLFDFNPSAMLDVAIVKALCAAAIEKMCMIRDSEKSTNPMKRMAAVAITQMEITQMVAVKAYFAKG